jgi:hypothetical protein
VPIAPPHTQSRLALHARDFVDLPRAVVGGPLADLLTAGEWTTYDSAGQVYKITRMKR